MVSQVENVETWPWMACLKRATSYMLRDKLFARDVPVPVTQVEREYIEHFAVERRVAPGWDEDYDDDEAHRVVEVCLFDFATNPDPRNEHGTELNARKGDPFAAFNAAEARRLAAAKTPNPGAPA